jgi:hypothetical protein
LGAGTALGGVDGAVLGAEMLYAFSSTGAGALVVPELTALTFLDSAFLRLNIIPSQYRRLKFPVMSEQKEHAEADQYLLNQKPGHALTLRN